MVPLIGGVALSNQGLGEVATDSARPRLRRIESRMSVGGRRQAT
jgi:hypothetical protein